MNFTLERVKMSITLSTYGIEFPQSYEDAIVVIKELLNRCEQLNEIIEELENE